MTNLILYLFMFGIYEVNSNLTFTMEDNSEGLTLQMACSHPWPTSSMFQVLFQRKLSLGSHESSSTFAKLSGNGSNLELIQKGIPNVIYAGMKGKCPAINISSADCRDSGKYKCIVSLMLSNSSENTTDDRDGVSIYINVIPGQTLMIAIPQIISDILSTTLQLICTAPIGTNYTGEEIKWHWEYADAIDNVWRQYPTDSDVTYDPVVEDPDVKCKFLQNSTLKRKLTLEDNRRAYRCYISKKREEEWVQYDRYASVYYVIENNVPDTQPTSYFNLFVLACILFGLVFLPLVIMAVVCFIRLSKRSLIIRNSVNEAMTNRKRFIKRRDCCSRRYHTDIERQDSFESEMLTGPASSEGRFQGSDGKLSSAVKQMDIKISVDGHPDYGESMVDLMYRPGIDSQSRTFTEIVNGETYFAESDTNPRASVRGLMHYNSF